VPALFFAGRVLSDVDESRRGFTQINADSAESPIPL
jgi:hypothetical protein